MRTFSSKRYRYIGKEKDEESGLYQLGARYYAPWTCKFLSVDPLAAKYAHQSSYCYGNCNPIFYCDPSGMDPSEQSPAQQNPAQPNTGDKSGHDNSKADNLQCGTSPQNPTDDSKPGEEIKLSDVKPNYSDNKTATSNKDPSLSKGPFLTAEDKLKIDRLLESSKQTSKEYEAIKAKYAGNEKAWEESSKELTEGIKTLDKMKQELQDLKKLNNDNRVQIENSIARIDQTLGREPQTNTNTNNGDINQTDNTAQQILNSGRVTFDTRHSGAPTQYEHDSATANKSISDAAANRPSQTSPYSDVGKTYVNLNPNMLTAMLNLSQTYTFTVSELSGGLHSGPASFHYAGNAIDIYVINGNYVNANNPDFRAFMQAARNSGATEVLGPGNAGHATHVHIAGWPNQ